MLYYDISHNYYLVVERKTKNVIERIHIECQCGQCLESSARLWS